MLTGENQRPVLATSSALAVALYLATALAAGATHTTGSFYNRQAPSLHRVHAALVCRSTLELRLHEWGNWFPGVPHSIPFRHGPVEYRALLSESFDTTNYRG